MLGRIVLSAIALSMAAPRCQKDNPAFVEASGTGTGGATTEADGGSVADATVADATAGSADAGSDTTSAVATSGGSSTGPDLSTTTADEGSSSDAASSGTGNGVADVGFPCAQDADCDPATGAECCTAMQCKDTCFVPCGDVTDCPDAEMGCVHGYCLFPCNDDDADCAAWPGLQCKHGGMYCEV